MAIITRSFKITTTASQDLFTLDTDATILGMTKSGLYSQISMGLFDSTITRYNTPIWLQDGTYTKKITIFIPQGTIISIYPTSNASVSTPEYFNITYYYEDSSNDTINPVGVWNSTTTYAKNSIVYRNTNNTSYIANVSNINKPPESSSGYWQILAAQNSDLNINLSSELTSDTPGVLTSNTTSLGVGTTLTDKTLTGTTRFSDGRIYNTAGTFYWQLPLISYGELVDTNSSQTLTSKTFSQCTFSNPSLNGTINFTQGSILNLTNTYLVETINSLSFFSNNLTFSTNIYGISKVSTPATASAILTITLPTINSTNTGTSVLLFITMTAATQTINWVNTKIAGSVSPSATAGATDIYSIINDGTYWYLTLLDKGFV
jgi:hypothetical protein